jgi:mRNA-degrading endonuclease RelE of RelBE toxin-antitoxin system
VGKYSVELKPSARKELERLTPTVIARIFPRLEMLADELRPAGCKKLKAVKKSGGFGWEITALSIRSTTQSSE